VAYDPAAGTITVTLTASGLTPGAHAAHIHIGSCMSQGPVQYMLMDFTADSGGQIMHEVRTVTGVTTPLPATGWYLNLHQGTSSNILAKRPADPGLPAAALCRNLRVPQRVPRPPETSPPVPQRIAPSRQQS
jgi:hypothetical protein